MPHDLHATAAHRDPGAPRPLIPALVPLERAVAPLAEPLLRITAGLMLVPHGLGKWNNGTAGLAQGLEGAGLAPGWFWANAVMYTELLGGLLLALGLFTRVAAAFCTLFLATAIFWHWDQGYFWSNRGWEMPLLWTVACLYFWLRGGGRFSLDRAIGREI